MSFGGAVMANGTRDFSGAWILWWRIDPDELKRQVLEYDYLGLFGAMRGLSALCLALSGAITVGMIQFHFGGADQWSYVDVGLFAFLAVFIWFGHRWAILGAMLLWTAEKAIMISDSVGTSGAGARVFMQVVWWCVFMHAFYFAFRIEQRRRRIARETAVRRPGWKRLLRFLRKTLVAIFAVAAAAAAVIAAFMAFTGVFEYGRFAGPGGTLEVTASNTRGIDLRFAYLTVTGGSGTATYAFDRGEWDELARLWRKAEQTDSKTYRLVGSMLEADTNTSRLFLYGGPGTRFVLREGSACVQYDMAPADFARFDASLLRVKDHFAGRITGGAWGPGPVERMIGGLEGVSQTVPVPPQSPSCS